MGLHTMILEHLDFLRNQLNSLPLYQRYPPHKKIVKKIDVAKETKFFMKKIDYVVLRYYSIKTLLAYEIGSMPYYLLKNGHLRKAKKNELRNTLKKIVPVCSSKVPNSTMIVAVIVNFMRHARKLPNKKLNLCTCHDLASHLWKTFIQIYEIATRIDIVFDLYILNSIKNDERDRRESINGTGTSIHSSELIRPVEMNLFWVFSKSKMTF